MHQMLPLWGSCREATEGVFPTYFFSPRPPNGSRSFT